MEANVCSGAVVKWQICASVDPFIKDAFARHELFVTRGTSLGCAHNFCRGWQSVWRMCLSLLSPGVSSNSRLSCYCFLNFKHKYDVWSISGTVYFVLLGQIHKRQKYQGNISLFHVMHITCNWNEVPHPCLYSVTTSFTLSLYNGSVTDGSRRMLSSLVQGCFL